MRFSQVALTLWLFAAASVCTAAEPPVTCLQFSPDGKQVVAGSQAGIDVCGWPDLNRTRTLKLEFANIHDVKFSHDGDRLAVAGGDPGERGIVQIFSWPQLEPLTRIEQHGDDVYAVDWTMDSRGIVSAGLDRRVVIYDVQQGKLLQTIEGHSKGVTTACLLNGDKLLVSAGIDQSLRVWETATGKPVRTLDNHTGAVHDVELRPADEPAGLPVVVSCSDDRTVRFWQPTIGRMVRFVRLDSVPLTVAWIPGSQVVAAATTAGTVVLIDYPTAAVLREIPVSEHWLYALAVHPNGESLVTGARRGELKQIPLKLK